MNGAPTQTNENFDYFEKKSPIFLENAKYTLSLQRKTEKFLSSSVG